MTLPLLAVVVFGCVLVAWARELRHNEEMLPTLRAGRHVPPYAMVVIATLVAAWIVIQPVRSLTEWPRSTQVAWTAVDAADHTSGVLEIGGAESSAILGWPNGNFWPAMCVEPAANGAFRLVTRGGEAIVRAGEAYANGEGIPLGGGAKQIGKFSIEYRDTFLWWRPKILIGRSGVAEPLVKIDPPPAHATRVRVLDSLLVPRLNDLRRNGEIDLATVHALEAWAGTIRVLRPNGDELRVVADGDRERELIVQPSSTVEILWPRRRLGMHVSARDGATRLTFEPPWMRTTSLPPFDAKQESSLSFAREAAIGANTFLLPLGHGAPDYRHDEALVISPAGLPRFRDGADLLPQTASSAPSFARGKSRRAASTLNRSLSSVQIPLVVRGAPGMVLTITMVRDLPTPRALFLALLAAWLALALFFASIAFGNGRHMRLRDLWCVGGVLVAIWTLLLFRVLLAVRYLIAPAAIDEVTVKGLAGSLAALVIVPGLMALAVRLWVHHRPGIATDARDRTITAAVAALLVVMTAIEFMVMPRQILPNVAARFTSSPFDRLLLVVYLIAILAVIRAADVLWQIPYRAAFDLGRAFWRALHEASNAAPRTFVQPVRNVWTALRSPHVTLGFTLWGAGSIAILALSRFAPEYVRQIVAPFWILGLPALVLLARPLTAADDALRVLDGAAPAARETPLADVIAAVLLLAFAPVAVLFGVLGDFGAIYTVLAFWLPLALLLLLTPAYRMATAMLAVFVVAVAVAYWALLGTYAIAPGMTEHILSRVEVMKHGSSAQEWLLDLEAPSAGDAKSVTAANVRNALVHEWEHMALVRKGGWTGLGYNHAPAAQSYIRQDTIQYDSVFSFFVAGEHGTIGGMLLLAIFAAPAILLLLRRSSLRIGDILALAIAIALLGEAVAHAAMNVSQLWFSGRNLPLLATSSNSDALRWGLLLGLMCQALLWSSRLDAESHDLAPETAVTRGSIFDPAFAYKARRRWMRLAALAIVATGLVAAIVSRDFAWFAFACLIPLAMLLRTRQYAALALMPSILVGVLVLRGAVHAMNSEEYDILTWSRLLKRVDELYDARRLQFDPATKRILFREEDGTLTDRPTGATLLEAEVLRFNSMPERLRMDGGRESLPQAFFSGAATPADYYARMYSLWQQQMERDPRTRPSVFTIQRVESDSEGATEVRYEVRGNPDFNVVHTFAEDLREQEMQPVSIRGKDGPVEVLGHAWVMGRWVYAPSLEARQLGLGWLYEAGEALFRAGGDRRKRATQLTLEEDLQRDAQTAAEAAGRELFGGLLANRAPSALPPRVAFTIMRATDGETLAMGAWPRAASGDRWRGRDVSDGTRSWRELEPPLSWLGSSAPRALASRQAVDHNFTAIEMGSAAKPFWATSALVVHPTLDRSLLVRNGDCDRVANQRCYERELFGATISNKGWQVSPLARWVDFSTYLAASDNRYHTRLGFLGLAKEGKSGIVSDGRGATHADRESLSGSRTPWNRYPALADSIENTRDRAGRLSNLHRQPLANEMRDLFGVTTGAPAAEGEVRHHLLSFWSGDERDDLRTSEGLEPLSSVSPEAVDLRLNGITDTREYIAVLLGGASSRWSNIAAAAAFSSWAMRKPVVAHIVVRKNAPVALPSRVAAFDDRARTAAGKLDSGLRRVISEGTALAIRGRIAPLTSNYDVYAKTGTLVTTDPYRPTSRILMVIIARDGSGNVRNAITLSFVAERSLPGFATEQVGRFIARHEDELVRLLDTEGAGR